MRWTRRRRARGAAVEAALREELSREPRWMFPWPLPDGMEVPLLGDNLPAIHATRAAMMEPIVRAALEEAGPDATAIDLACNEGWFCHRLLEWGARRVVGIDIRPQLIRRAQLMRDYHGVSPKRLELRCADALAPDPRALEPADVVLAMGIVYHVEEPVRLLRVARSLTRRLCLVESQLARDPGPVHFAWGQNSPPGVDTMETPALLGAFFEGDQDTNPLASAGQVLSFVPNASALYLMMHVSGFRTVQMLPAGEQADYQYRSQDRVVMAGYP